MSESAADAIAERYGVDHLPDDMPGFNCLSPLSRCAANRRAVCARRGDWVNVVNVVK